MLVKLPLMNAEFLDTPFVNTAFVAAIQFKDEYNGTIKDGQVVADWVSVFIKDAQGNSLVQADFLTRPQAEMWADEVARIINKATEPSGIKLQKDGFGDVFCCPNCKATGKHNVTFGYGVESQYQCIVCKWTGTRQQCFAPGDDGTILCDTGW